MNDDPSQTFDHDPKNRGQRHPGHGRRHPVPSRWWTLAGHRPPEDARKRTEDRPAGDHRLRHSFQEPPRPVHASLRRPPGRSGRSLPRSTADRDGPASAKDSRGEFCVAYQDGLEMLANADLDAVVITTPGPCTRGRRRGGMPSGSPRLLREAALGEPSRKAGPSPMPPPRRGVAFQVGSQQAERVQPPLRSSRGVRPQRFDRGHPAGVHRRRRSPDPM